jgi:two-component system response regulator MtrA
MGTIVMAEDDADIRDLIHEKLSRSGHQVTATGDGAAALVAVRSQQPDVVVLDMQMPGLSGLDVLRLLRGDPLTAHVPVIMVTAHSEPAYVGESFNSGVNDFLAKPFSPRELALRVDRLLADPTSVERPTPPAEVEAAPSGQTASTASGVGQAAEPAEVKVADRRAFLRRLAL